MVWLRGLAQDAGGIAWNDRWWLCWNTFLAAVPVLLAVPLFRHRGRWRAFSWIGLAAFVLVLPNAPYVFTDLVHLRADVAQAGSDATVYLGILPLYAAFIAIGFGCYAASLREVGAWLRRIGRQQSIGPVELALHGLSAVGVLLGRVAHLNSWETVTHPEATMGRALDTLSWRASPIVLVALFTAIWLGHAITRALATSGMTWAGTHVPRLRGTNSAATA